MQELVAWEQVMSDERGGEREAQTCLSHSTVASLTWNQHYRVLMEFLCVCSVRRSDVQEPNKITWGFVWLLRGVAKILHWNSGDEEENNCDRLL